MKPKVIVIVGPTASGKTALSIEVAKRVNGEIISSDSMQIYKEMDIGTAKVTKDEMQGIKHYLVDFVSPEQRYTVSNFKNDAEKAIEEILSKGKTPVIVGGTGLYINSLIYGIEYQEMNFDEQYRNELMEIAETEDGLKSLYSQALEIDPEAMKIISENDKKRIIRVLEIFNATGKNKTENEILSRKNGVKYDYKVFALNMDREVLYDRINYRVDKMFEMGLLEEVRNLVSKYDRFTTSMQAIGYKEVLEYLNNETSYEEMVEKIKQGSRNYAKRQLTWFRKNKEIVWLDALEKIENNVNIILEGVNGEQ